IHACHQMDSVEDILAMKDVRERSELFHAHTEPFIDQLRRVSTVHDDVVVVDLRDEETIYAGNRFMVYALHPQARISIHVLWAGTSRTPCSRSESRSSTARHRSTSVRSCW